MKLFRVFSMATIFTGLALAAMAASPGKLPDRPSTISADLKDYAFRIPKEAAKLETITVTGQPFDKAFRVTIRELMPNGRDIQINTPTIADFRTGEYGILTFYARSVNPPSDGVEPAVTMLFERSSSPWKKFLNARIKLTPEWKKYEVPFQILPSFGRSKKDVYKSGEAHLAVNLGFQPQTIELGGCAVRNYGKDIDLALLPIGNATYPGREPDAAWRKQAAERIEKLRKGDFSLTVVDRDGKPVSGAEITVDMQKHAFIFGSCLNLGKWKSKKPEDQRYREEFTKLFNMAVFEGSMKWNDGWSYSPELKSCLQWLKSNDILVRGHCLIWPAWRWLPHGLKPLEKEPAFMRQVVRDHIFYEASMLNRDVVEWDVMNEPFNNHDLMDILGRDVMIEWFKTAKLAAPGQRMFINEAGIPCTRMATNQRVKDYQETIAYLLKNGAPLEGIGIQGHFDEDLPGPEEVLWLLDRLGRFGVPVRMTEYDLYSFNDQLEADYLRDMLTVMFSHPASSGFLMWGFWDGMHWRYDAAIFRKDWSLKPSGQVYKDLVFKQWWTNLQGKTAADGKFSGRGFFGDYRYRVKAGDRNIEGKLTLSKSGQECRITLP